jgi:hypothetical protein
MSDSSQGECVRDPVGASRASFQRIDPLLLEALLLVLAIAGCGNGASIPTNPTPGASATQLFRISFPSDGAIRHWGASPRYLFVGGRRVTGRKDVLYRDGTLFIGEDPIDPMPPDTLTRWETARRDSDTYSRLAASHSEDVPMMRRLIREGMEPTEAARRWRAAEGAMFGRLMTAMVTRARRGGRLSPEEASALLDSELVETDPRSPHAPRIDRLRWQVYVHGVGEQGLRLMDPDSIIIEHAPEVVDSFAIARGRALTLQEHLRFPGPLVVFLSSTGKLYLHGDKALDAIAQIEATGAVRGVASPRPGAEHRVPLGRFLDEIRFAESLR